MQFWSAAEQELLLAVAIQVIRRQHDGFGQFRKPFARPRVEDRESGFTVAVFVLDRHQNERVPGVVQVVDQAGAGRSNCDALLVLIFGAADQVRSAIEAVEAFDDRVLR